MKFFVSFNRDGVVLEIHLQTCSSFAQRTRGSWNFSSKQISSTTLSQFETCLEAEVSQLFDHNYLSV